MTVADLISFGREWSVRWSVYAGASGTSCNVTPGR